jgi:O-antigen/teichoic acid export membrane protein
VAAGDVAVRRGGSAVLIVGSGRRRAVAWSIVFGYGALALALIRNVVLVPIYLHYIDLSEYGAWLATGGALAQILVTDFGLAGVVVQRVAHSMGAGDLVRLRALIGAGLVNGAALALALTLLCVALAPILPTMHGLSEMQTHRVLQCFLLAVGANGSAVIGNTAAGIVRSMQRAAAAGSLILIADLVGVIATVSALLLGLGLYALPLGLLGRSLTTMLGGLGVLAGMWIGEQWPRLRFDRTESLALWRDSLQFFLTSVAMKVQSNANVLFVGILAGPQSAAIYGLTVRAHETVLLLISQTNTALAPSLAHLLGGNGQERFRQLLLKLLYITAAISAVGMATTVALNEMFVHLWVGAAFGGQGTSVLMGIALWVASIAYVAYEALLADGQFRPIARTFIAASALHVVLLLVLVRWGMWGAPVALLLTTLAWGAVLWRRVARNIRLSSSEALDATGEIAKIVLLCAATVALVITVFPKVTSWCNLTAEGLTGVSASVLALFAFRPNLRVLVREEFAHVWR